MYTILESVLIEIMFYSNMNKVKLLHIDVPDTEVLYLLIW